MSKKMGLLLVLVVSLFLAVACGEDENGNGGGESGSGGSGELSNCNISGYDIYLGYYTEDASANPEDPTAGFIVACMPSSDGSFKTEFLFSYFGCQGGVDKGTVNGDRTGDNISGTWFGTVDGVNIGGDFSGIWDGTKFGGTWDNGSGKVHIQEGDCEYYVSPYGQWELYALDTDEGGLNIDISGTDISWNNSIAGVSGFLISVYDKQCMYERISISECTMWSVACLSSVSSLTYGSVPSDACIELFPAQPLTSGEDYLVGITAYGSSQTDIRAFGTKTFNAP